LFTLPEGRANRDSILMVGAGHAREQGIGVVIAGMVCPYGQIMVINGAALCQVAVPVFFYDAD